MPIRKCIYRIINKIIIGGAINIGNNAEFDAFHNNNNISDINKLLSLKKVRWKENLFGNTLVLYSDTADPIESNKYKILLQTKNNWLYKSDFITNNIQIWMGLIDLYKNKEAKFEYSEIILDEILSK